MNYENKFHFLDHHLLAVSEQAYKLASKFKSGEIAYWVGRWHDIGKADPMFQAYLKSGDKKYWCDHKTLGAYHSMKFSDILPLIILGHHGGLSCPTDIKNKLKRIDDSLRRKYDDQLRALPSYLENIIHPENSMGMLPVWVHKNNEPLVAEFYIRMLYSTLVDADFLDTEKHFHPQRTVARTGFASLDDLSKRFTENQKRITGRNDSSLNKIRNEVYLKCLESSKRLPNIYRLTVPTGGGKTRSSLAFSLSHANKHNLDRIIYVIPYTSIIEQTARVFKGILGDNNIIEHHSSTDITRESEKEYINNERVRLSSENWDAPVIVTTTVQFFESLFANKPARCRKLHNIAKSVIILDEVQLLPPAFLMPILDVLWQLVSYYGCTVVLCTATQPAFEDVDKPNGFDKAIDIIPETHKYFRKLKRVDYRIIKEKWSWDKVAEKIRSFKQVLAIVNTKKDAGKLMDVLGDGYFHLSTLLCGAHRRYVLEEIKKRLDNDEPCRLISTQVVEAGVDLDFPIVFRAMGPLDSIVQAAGRCNREGRLDSGKVVIFNPADGNKPRGAYATAISAAESVMLSDKFDFFNPDCYAEYFKYYFSNVFTDAKDINRYRRSLDFPMVAQKFKLIDDDTFSVLVAYDYGRELINKWSNPGFNPTRYDYREIQPYLVNIRKRDCERLLNQGMLKELKAELYEWRGKYDPIRGIIEAHDPSMFIV